MIFFRFGWRPYFNFRYKEASRGNNNSTLYKPNLDSIGVAVGILLLAAVRLGGSRQRQNTVHGTKVKPTCLAGLKRAGPERARIFRPVQGSSLCYIGVTSDPNYHGSTDVAWLIDEWYLYHKRCDSCQWDLPMKKEDLCRRERAEHMTIQIEMCRDSQRKMWCVVMFVDGHWPWGMASACSFECLTRASMERTMI